MPGVSRRPLVFSRAKRCMGAGVKAWQGVMESLATHPQLAGAQSLTTQPWSGPSSRSMEARSGWSDAHSGSIDRPCRWPKEPLPVDDRDATAGRRDVFLADGRARGVGCEGVMAESIAMPVGQSFERLYCGAHHLLIGHERLTRRRGCTTVEGLPACRLENLSDTLTFVPAGRQFREWHVPEVPSRAIYIYIDPCAPIITADPRLASEPWDVRARIHFRSPSLWQTVLKLKRVLDGHGAPWPHYGTALGIVLVHELAEEDDRRPAPATRGRGGLAAWQRRAVAQYIQEHLGESISIAALASHARLSRYHFGRAFKVSFGSSPHRFHSQLRFERAKELLSTSALSVTQIALEVGFQETSSFSLAFRRLAGLTPSRYRRSFLAEQG